jgi:hypothetical protein
MTLEIIKLATEDIDKGRLTIGDYFLGPWNSAIHAQEGKKLHAFGKSYGHELVGGLAGGAAGAGVGAGIGGLIGKLTRKSGAKGAAIGSIIGAYPGIIGGQIKGLSVAKKKLAREGVFDK